MKLCPGLIGIWGKRRNQSTVRRHVWEQSLMFL